MKHVHLRGNLVHGGVFLNEFDIEIDRFMLDCSAKGLSVKTLKSYEQTIRLFAKWMFVEFEIDSPRLVKAEFGRTREI